MLNQAEFVRVSIRTLDRYFEKSIQGKVEQTGFTMPQMRLVEEVVAHRGIGIKQLAQNLQMTQSTVSPIVDRLIDHGILRKTTNRRDRRAVEVWPTENVEKFMASDRQEFVNRPVADLLERLSPTERDTVLLALRLLMDRLDSVRGERA